MRGTSVGRMLVAGTSVVRKWLVAPESRMAHRLMVAALVVIVLFLDGGGECIIMGGDQATSGIN